MKDHKGQIIWSNQHPNSRLTNQPIALLYEKENIKTVTELMNFLNPQIDELMSNGFENETGHINIQINASMLDGKCAPYLLVVVELFVNAA